MNCTRSPVPSAMADAGMLAVAGTPDALAERIATKQRYWQGVLRWSATHGRRCRPRRNRPRGMS